MHDTTNGIPDVGPSVGTVQKSDVFLGNRTNPADPTTVDWTADPSTFPEWITEPFASTGGKPAAAVCLCGATPGYMEEYASDGKTTGLDWYLKHARGYYPPERLYIKTAPNLWRRYHGEEAKPEPEPPHADSVDWAAVGRGEIEAPPVVVDRPQGPPHALDGALKRVAELFCARPAPKPTTPPPLQDLTWDELRPEEQRAVAALGLGPLRFEDADASRWRLRWEGHSLWDAAAARGVKPGFCRRSDGVGFFAWAYLEARAPGSRRWVEVTL